MGKALLMVRAELADSVDRQAFDRWYEAEHLPDALRTFGAERAWRCWAEADPSAHYALYEFADMRAVKAALAADGMRRLIGDFDRAWGTRVRRTRDILQLVQSVAAQDAR